MLVQIIKTVWKAYKDKTDSQRVLMTEIYKEEEIDGGHSVAAFSRRIFWRYER